MGKPWKCRFGWHAFVRETGQDNPNHQICIRCGKKRNLDTGMMLGGGLGG
jgi:hypothetical protein